MLKALNPKNSSIMCDTLVATRPWSRRAMYVSARARGHLDVARVTEQQQGLADEVVFTLVVSISSMVRIWLSRK